MADDQSWLDGLGPEFWDIVAVAERRGWITYREINMALPRVEYPSPEIEALFGWLNERGIAVVERQPD